MTSLLSLVALSALTPAILQPAWQTDYQAALARGVSQNKPLAVFLGTGPDGWSSVSQEGQLSPDVQQLLRAKYVPVYLNTDTEEGKALASSFELPGGIGLVLSDREGQKQAFWHHGTLAAADLAGALQRYADPQGPVVTTESDQVTRTSLYPPSSAPPIYAEPALRFQPGFAAGCSH